MPFTPWTSEPQGDGFAYMARASGPGAMSWVFFRWPSVGYVEAEGWEGGEGEGPWHTYPAKKLRGLSGFLFGGAIPELWREPLLALGYGAVFQVLKVALSELRLKRNGRHHVAPRAWVKHSGAFEEVMEALSNESLTAMEAGDIATSYAADTVRRNIAAGYAASGNGDPQRKSEIWNAICSEHAEKVAELKRLRATTVRRH